jgi:ribosomal protein S18 acetylase RimI-like enzyme
MLDLASRLSEPALDALAALERQVVAADGGRLKLEWGVLRARDDGPPQDLLWWEDDRLCGFLGIYAFSGLPELAGMVAPDRRRRGIAATLLDTALALCRTRGRDQVLLIVPRQSQAGRGLALARGGTLDHSEHALVLTGPPPVPTPGDPSVTLRARTEADLPEVSRILEAGFGAPPTADQLGSSRGRTTVVIEHEDRVVGTAALTIEGERGSIYGFAIAPELRGRGLGRAALLAMFPWLRERGATQEIALEVAVENERALGLYTSVGFTALATEDYYTLAT